MTRAPEVFRQYFFEDVPGAAEALREAASSAMAAFTESAGYRQLREQSAEAWRRVGIDPELPFIARHRMLCEAAGLSWPEGESLADEPPCDFMPILWKRAKANAAAQSEPVAQWSESRAQKAWLKIFDRSERWLREMRTRFPSEFSGKPSRLRVSLEFLRSHGVELD